MLSSTLLQPTFDRRIKPSIHFYSVCGIELSDLVNHLSAFDLGLSGSSEIAGFAPAQCRSVCR